MDKFYIDSSLRSAMIEMIETIRDQSAENRSIRSDLQIRKEKEKECLDILKSKGYLLFKREASDGPPQDFSVQSLQSYERAKKEIIGLKGEWQEFLAHLKQQEKTGSDTYSVT